MPQPKTDKAILALADGSVFHGYAIGHVGTTAGEICFNTSMTGYQEVFTDPSYHGQLMMMSYPHIGNYGVSERDDEAHKVMISGLIVRAFSHAFSNPMADEGLNSYLKRNKITGITGVDTRKLVRHIRTNGVQNAVISSDNLDEADLVRQAKSWPSMVGLELASRISRTEPRSFKPGEHAYFHTDTMKTDIGEAPEKKDILRIAALDYGIKRNIINSFVHRGCMVRVFPAKTDIDDIMKWSPDAFFLSNGPGDPNAMDYAIDFTNKAIETGKPIFGICLGHQLLALASGMKVIKMLVGHRGANQPVKNLKRGRVEITTQNHGFAVDPDSLNEDVAEITHQNLNDGTLEGLEYKKFNGFGVQYHPEASPGPHDSSYLFDEFVDRIKSNKALNGSS
ncbi:glutamine-hydrolyzing carbamoyl-phosphate synthase small subunit [Balneolaceae bacterium ANBcel3]|nr:glutamine-hydrolyzing carbamoyl-phosphate synthase small subunit [Balneolaceae bacterium ANBcel3]